MAAHTMVILPPPSPEDVIRHHANKLVDIASRLLHENERLRTAECQLARMYGEALDEIAELRDKLRQCETQVDELQDLNRAGVDR